MGDKKLEFENLRDLIQISSPVLAMDGVHIVYSKGISDYRTGKIRTQLIEKNLQTGEAASLLEERWIQKDAAYSPDGTKLAFLASDGRPWQLWIRECKTGKTVQATHARYGIENFHWLEDSRLLSVTIITYPNDAHLSETEMSAEEFVDFQKKKNEEPKVIETLSYKRDSAYGMLDDRKFVSRIWDFETGCFQTKPLNKQNESEVPKEQSESKAAEKLICPVEATSDEDCILDFAGPVQDKLLLLKSRWDRPAYLTLADLKTDADGRPEVSEETVVVDENNWLSEYSVTKPAPLEIKTTDGKSILHGWAAVPRTDCSSIPAVLYLPDEDEPSYQNRFFYETQMLVSRGIAVLFCERNETESGKSYEAVLSFLQAALKKYPQIDAKRVGVTGVGHAGSMLLKLISSTDAFSAAVIQRALVNPASAYGTGEYKSYRAEAGQGSFVEFMEIAVRTSSMNQIRRVHIPVLILHGENDSICPLEQGEQIYHALRSFHPELPIKIVIFPKENHAITKTGLLHNQIRHMQELVCWFETYLSEEGNRIEV